MYKLLIVDDEPLERQALRFFVEHSRLEIGGVLECGNGVDAVRLALTEQPDICILDIRMPGLSGLEVMEQVKSVNPKCRVIFSTAYSYFDYAVKALQLGALDFLVKPVKKEAFLRAINKAIDAVDAEQGEREYRRRAAGLCCVLEKRILQELVTGRIDEGTLWFLDERGIPAESPCCCFFWRLSRPLPDEEKRCVAKRLGAELLPAGYRHLLFVHQRSIDLVLFGTATLQRELAARTIRQIFEKALEDTCAKGDFAQGGWVEDVFSLELSYAEARQALGETTTPPPAGPPPRREAGPGPKSGAPPAEVQAICRYLRAHYAEKITLDDVTRQVGFSKYYGGRLFKQYMGTTIIDYLIQLRLDRPRSCWPRASTASSRSAIWLATRTPTILPGPLKKQPAFRRSSTAISRIRAETPHRNILEYSPAF